MATRPWKPGPFGPGTAEAARRRPGRVREALRTRSTRDRIVLAVFCALAFAASTIALKYPPRMALAVFLCLGGGIAVFLRPYLGVVAYFVLAFLRPQDLFWGLEGSRLSLAISVTTVAAALLHFGMRPRVDFLRSKQNAFLGLLWIALHLSTQFGRFGDPGTPWLDYYDKVFLFYFLVIALVTSEKELHLLAWTIAVCVGVLSLWANKEYFLGGVYVVRGPGSTFSDENDFAMLIVMAVPFMWYLARESPHRLVTLGLLALLPFAAHAVMVTYSRGGFLGLIAVGATIAVRERNRVLTGLMVGGSLVFYLMVAGANYQDRIGSISGYETDESAMARIESWKAGMRMIEDNPVFGVGLAQYVRAFPQYSPAVPRVAHNSWVQMGAEAGVVAVVSYSALILGALLALRSVHRRLRDLRGDRLRYARTLAGAYLGALVGYVVCGSFLSMEDMEFFYLLVAMTLILDRVTRSGPNGTGEGTPAPIPLEAGAGI